MEQRNITEEQIERYRQYLIRDEKSTATVEKYLRDVRAFLVYVGAMAITKEVTVAYKRHLLESYAPRSINSMLASVNSFLTFMGWTDCKVKALRNL